MPFGKETVVIDTGVTTATTVIDRALVAVPAVGVVESVTLTVKLVVPGVVGVPEITPVTALRVKPAGRLPTLTDQA